MKDKLKALKESALIRIETAKNAEELENYKVKYLGRKGQLTEILRLLPSLKKDERSLLGKAANELRQRIEASIVTRSRELTRERFTGIEESEWIDVTEPGAKIETGHLHPISQALYEMVSIFERLGFSVFESEEIETDFYNFQALNIPKGHPARDMQDTFYLSKDEQLLLRTHTSPGQIKAMKSLSLPIRVVLPGRVYRRDSDPTHSPMFFQVEGLLIDQTTNFAELKGTLSAFVKEFFGARRRVRFRPHHFPFTEPSAEMDVSCGVCNMTGRVNGEPCRACKASGWLEVMGAGMVHPTVLKYGGVDPAKYRGFAFGIGVERPAMLKWNIDDIHYFFENDVRFLEQF